MTISTSASKVDSDLAVSAPVYVGEVRDPASLCKGKF
jgi:hypothetical protein